MWACVALALCSGFDMYVACVCVYKIYCHCHRILNLCYNFFLVFCSIEKFVRTQNNNNCYWPTEEKSYFRPKRICEHSKIILAETSREGRNEKNNPEDSSVKRSRFADININVAKWNETMISSSVFNEIVPLCACSGSAKLSQYWQNTNCESNAARIEHFCKVKVELTFG